ncbi:MAG TPA: 2-oxo acid dehydrogenase subunit E2 [Acidimicrobiia bacterium]
MSTAQPLPLPWRVRAPRVRPAGFVPPRIRFGHASGNGGGAVDERIPFSRVRARAALALLDSKATAAHAHVVVPCDYSAVDAARAGARATFAAVEGFSLTALPFVAVAVCRALRAFPDVNVTVADDGSIVEHRGVALGVAVDLAHTGLVVPVVRDADVLTLRGLARAIHGIAAQARDKMLRPDDLMGGTFTITNPGSHGTALSFPIIHRPQAAILVTDGVHKSVVAGTTQSQLDIRPIGMLGLGFDHRVIDHHTAGAFTAFVRDELQSTDWSRHLR